MTWHKICNNDSVVKFNLTGNYMNYYTQLVHKNCSISIYFECIATNLYTIKYVLEYTESSITVEPRGYIKTVKPESSRFNLDLEKIGIKFNDCEVRQELTSY